MASFELSGPDGEAYRVEAADEASARAALQSALGVPAVPSSPVDVATTLWETGKGLGKSLGTGVAEGVIGAVGLPGDLYHLGRQSLGYSEPPEAAYGSKALQNRIEQYTGEFYHPKGICRRGISSTVTARPIPVDAAGGG